MDRGSPGWSRAPTVCVVRYEVVGLLGRGGAAVVELAVDGHGRRVATKRVFVSGSAGQIRAAQQRLKREAEILGKLRHPGIVPILDVVEQEGEIVLVFPALAENLEDRVERLGPLSPSEVIRIGRDLLAALAVAHRHGVVHRDIKPTNVLFDEAVRPALADFGVAATWELTGGLTPRGEVIGTPMWMAPEQARGAVASPAGDVFAMAATLAYALTGQRPYGSGPPELMMARAARGDVASIPDHVPESLRVPLEAMLDPVPERRPSASAALGGMDGTLQSPVIRAGRRDRVGGVGRRWKRGAALVLGDRPRRRSRGRGFRAATTALVLTAATAASLAGLALTSRPVQPPAPHTNGKTCLPGWYDLDHVAANGCESSSDFVAGMVLTTGVPIRANVVPLSATDSYMTHVSGDSLNLCWGSLHVTLTAPPGTAEQLTVWKGKSKVALAVSSGGNPATATVSKPSCFGADSEDLRVTVTVVAATGAASGRDFTLTRDGGW